MCFIVGDEGRRVERLDEESVKNEVEEVLTKVFKDKIKKWDIKIDKEIDESTIFRPIDIHVCKWDTDERYLGSYAFQPVGSGFEKDEIWENFACALPKNEDENSILFFAGEAYSKRYAGYIQGAYKSGEDVAQQIIEQILEL